MEHPIREAAERSRRLRTRAAESRAELAAAIEAHRAALEQVLGHPIARPARRARASAGAGARRGSSDRSPPAA
jgi:hypothetical protein